MDKAVITEEWMALRMGELKQAKDQKEAELNNIIGQLFEAQQCFKWIREETQRLKEAKQVVEP